MSSRSPLWRAATILTPVFFTKAQAKATFLDPGGGRYLARHPRGVYTARSSTAEEPARFVS